MFSFSVISTTQGSSLRLLWFILPKWRLNVSLAALKLAEIYVVGCCWNSEEQKYRLFCSYFSITFQWFFLSLGLISAVHLWKLLIQNIKISIRFNIPIRMKSLHNSIYVHLWGKTGLIRKPTNRGGSWAKLSHKLWVMVWYLTHLCPQPEISMVIFLYMKHQGRWYYSFILSNSPALKTHGPLWVEDWLKWIV